MAGYVRTCNLGPPSLLLCPLFYTETPARIMQYHFRVSVHPTFTVSNFNQLVI